MRFSFGMLLSLCIYNVSFLWLCNSLLCNFDVSLLGVYGWRDVSSFETQHNPFQYEYWTVFPVYIYLSVPELSLLAH